MSETQVFTFRVKGVATGHRSYVQEFNETYEIDGEHPAHALEKLVRHEIEWGILDSDLPFTITFVARPEATNE